MEKIVTNENKLFIGNYKTIYIFFQGMTNTRLVGFHGIFLTTCTLLCLEDKHNKLQYHLMYSHSELSHKIFSFIFYSRCTYFISTDISCKISRILLMHWSVYIFGLYGYVICVHFFFVDLYQTRILIHNIMLNIKVLILLYVSWKCVFDCMSMRWPSVSERLLSCDIN